MDRLGQLRDLLDILVPLSVRNKIHDHKVDRNSIRRSIINAFGAPAYCTKNLPIILRSSVRTSPTPTNPRIVKILTGKSPLRNPFITNLWNGLEQSPQKLQSIVLDIVGKFDEATFLESVK